MKRTEKIFLNYGTVGLMGEPAYLAATKFLQAYYEVGPPEVLIEYEPYVEKLTQEISTLLSCDKEEVVYIKNTTEGLFLASEALPLYPGDEVIVSSREYPATLLTWFKKRKDGITVTVLHRESSEGLEDALISAITPKTKVITVAWAQHQDGYVPDLNRLGRACRERGIYLVVDGVQGVGVRGLNLAETPVDILVCGGQKYLGGIVGIGFMYVRKEILKDLKDIKVGLRSMESFTQDSYTIRNTARRFEDGTINLLGVVALHAALEHINKVGIEEVSARGTALLLQHKAILRERGISFIDHKNQSNIITIETKDPAALAQCLREQKVYVRALTGAIRLSFIHNSSPEEFAYAADKIAEWFALNPEARKEITPTFQQELAPIR